MKSFVKRNGVWIGFLLLAVIVTFLTMDWATYESRFLSPRNLTNVLRQTSINGVLAVERTKKHMKAKASAATEIVAKAHEWTDPNTILVYAYEEDGEETGKTVRADFLFTLTVDAAGKLKIVKTQQLSETESQKYERDPQS